MTRFREARRPAHRLAAMILLASLMVGGHSPVEVLGEGSVAHAEEGQLAIAVETYPEEVRVGEEVTFILRAKAPDYTALHYSEMCFEPDSCSAAARLLHQCLQLGQSVWDSVMFALPNEVLAVLQPGPPYTFRWTYREAGIYEVDAFVQGTHFSMSPCDEGRQVEARERLVVEVRQPS